LIEINIKRVNKGDGLNLPQFDGHLEMGTIEPKGVSDEQEEGI